MSYTKGAYHIVFRTKRSENSINEKYERELYSYIYGFCKNRDCFVYRIGGMPNHIHILIDLNPSIALSSFMMTLKSETSKWLKDNTNFPHFNGWGEGYAAFSYSHDMIPTIINYIRSQKEHHKKVSFADEYRQFIIENGIALDERFFLRDEE